MHLQLYVEVLVWPTAETHLHRLPSIVITPFYGPPIIQPTSQPASRRVAKLAEGFARACIGAKARRADTTLAASMDLRELQRVSERRQKVRVALIPADQTTHPTGTHDVSK